MILFGYAGQKKVDACLTFSLRYAKLRSNMPYIGETPLFYQIEKWFGKILGDSLLICINKPN